MSYFSARVQLPGYPTSENYVRLHQLMATVGFLRTIHGDDGREWNLPHGEYSANLPNVDAAAVRDRIQIALRAYFPTAEIIVTGGVSAWVNLKAAAPTKNPLAEALGLIR